NCISQWGYDFRPSYFKIDDLRKRFKDIPFLSLTATATAKFSKDIIQNLEPVIIDHFAAEWTSLNEYTLRPDARRFENWENNYAARLGLGAAVDYALEIGIENIWERIQKLALRLRQRLSERSNIKLTDIGSQQCGIVTFIVDGEDPFELQKNLRAMGINVSVSIPSSTLIDATRRRLPSILRASVHYYNNENEIDRLLRALP
ncbi:MAG: aminotransferase class V-fold PLP-dependent enzyme, partial [Rhodospirillales bacterium]